MRLLGATALFVLGVYLSVRVIGALYRIIDLWYTIRTAWPQVARGLVGWIGATALIALLAGEGYRPAFLWGLAAYAAFYLGLFPLAYLLIVQQRRLE